ncbi:hypothetical protein H181DRAFT_03400 [Streptomyces sp. WMMB 714]|nr:hypothetical protein H181DRAFT_03400 [Streptomyces sp. WMMB 714]
MLWSPTRPRGHWDIRTRSVARGQQAGLRTRGPVRVRRRTPTGRRFPAPYKTSAYDGGRSHSPLRGSPGFPPGSLFRRACLAGRTNQLHRQPSQEGGVRNTAGRAAPVPGCGPARSRASTGYGMCARTHCCTGRRRCGTPSPSTARRCGPGASAPVQGPAASCRRGRRPVQGAAPVRGAPDAACAVRTAPAPALRTAPGRRGDQASRWLVWEARRAASRRARIRESAWSGSVTGAGNGSRASRWAFGYSRRSVRP